MLTHYIIIRSDFQIGTALAMCTHAAGESSPGNLQEGTFAVVLEVPDESALLLLSEKLNEKQIPHKLVREPDEPYNNQAMSIGIVPCQRELVRDVVRHLKLYKGPKL